MGLRLLSLAFWGFFTVTSVALFPVALLIWLVTSPLDPRKALLHQFTCFWASLYTWFNPAWPVEIVGREKIRRDSVYVMVANHQSLIDIFVLFRLFAQFKWVSKVENFRLPFIGWNMTLNGYIKLVRGDRKSIMKMRQAGLETLRAGSSIMMFPEGTRSPDGRLRAFRPGAFDLAHKARCPILPIIIDGTASALPKRGFVLRGYHLVRIEVLDEIPYESFADESVEETTTRVQQLIASHLSECPEGTDTVAAA